jgi:hypothetical protein
MPSNEPPARTRAVIELHCQDRDGVVRVVPDDQDQMLLSVRDAIEACRAFDDQLRFGRQFDQLLQRLGEWVRERQASVRSAYLTARDFGLLFLLVRRGGQYDEALEESLTDLDLEVANDPDYSLIRLDVLAVPEVSAESLRSFLPLPITLEHHANG